MIHKEIFAKYAFPQFPNVGIDTFEKHNPELLAAILAAMAEVAPKPLPCSTVENMPPDDLDLREYSGMIAELWDETQDVIKETCYEKQPYRISDIDYTENGFAWGFSPEDKLNVKAILYKRQ